MHEASVPRCTEIPQVPDSGRRVLRVAEDREIEAALLFRSQRRRVVRVRRNLESLEERPWQRGGELLDSDHDAQHCNRSGPRPYACHP